MSNQNLSPRQLAQDILLNVGGKENIKSVAYCMTRLRIETNDLSKVDEKTIRALNGVLGLVKQDNQIQVILGPGRVIKVAKEVSEITGLELGEVDEAAVKKRRN
ncbi:PTS transporter subunit EIIB [Thermobrachium celere]|uniref:PTS transporter subunit EIIB n=1 Tax=Thermobrachium celere TaxID=53422 RepID=UPI001A3B2067|nr:PTS glucose/sucrose transporter subunit IIB [Thermobrachium celere]GFR36438.1 hypothetical protein TCEA9_22500 [Thermobrachium celere]